MKAEAPPAALVPALQVTPVDFRPIVRSYMQRLGLIELINEMVVTEMEVEPGIIVAGMIQDTLSGRSPLYRLEAFFQTQDSELLLGRKVDPATFKDHHVGRVMDRLYEVGTQRLFSEVARRAAVVFDLDVKTGHWDSTSVNVWGDYALCEQFAEDDERLKITFGYSKDKRPDLKQFLIGILCVDQNIPFLGGCQNGNSSDKKLNNKLLTTIAASLAQHGIQEDAFTYVADAALVTEDNLECFAPQPGKPPLYFVTRLPANYSEHARVITAAVTANQWQEVGTLNHTPATPKHPAATYRTYETKVTLYGREYRAIVVHSSAHDKRRQKRLDRELAADRAHLQTQLDTASTTVFACLTDATAALERLTSLPSAYHVVTGEIVARPCYRRGRPTKTGRQVVREVRYRLQTTIAEKPDAIATQRQEAGCFVLISNRPAAGPEAQTPAQLLRAYKGQHGIERNFSFLKDPLIVNDLFLKKPERVESLGLILLLSLMIWNLMQRSLRLYVTQKKTTLDGWDGKPTTRPTSFMMTTKFMGVLVVNMAGKRTVTPALNPVQLQYLEALGVNASIFTDPKPG